SKARLDFPEPLGPVTTVNFPSRRSTSMPLRLFWRAPRISMQSAAARFEARYFSATFEPTGDNSRWQTNSQISLEYSVICYTRFRAKKKRPTGAATNRCCRAQTRLLRSEWMYSRPRASEFQARMVVADRSSAKIHRAQGMLRCSGAPGLARESRNK